MEKQELVAGMSLSLGQQPGKGKQLCPCIDTSAAAQIAASQKFLLKIFLSYLIVKPFGFIIQPEKSRDPEKDMPPKAPEQPRCATEPRSSR
jgi:hypothetical protein